MVTLIAIGVAAVALGFWLGLPGRFEQSTDEIEQLMARGGSRRRKVKRRFTPLDWWRRDQLASDRRREESQRRFTTAAPERNDTPKELE
jgi:hypothetical protein